MSPVYGNVLPAKLFDVDLGGTYGTPVEPCAKGDTMEVPVRINTNGHRLNGYKLTVRFDPRLLALSSVGAEEWERVGVRKSPEVGPDHRSSYVVSAALQPASNANVSVLGIVASIGNPGPTIALARVDVSRSAAGTALEIGQLDGQQKRIAAMVTGFPHFDPTKERVKGNYA